MMDASKYRVGYFPVGKKYNKWVEKDHIEKTPVRCSVGMIPSSSFSSSACGLYEPIHGSAPDIAGKDIANPIGTILSAAMMLRYSFDMSDEADAIENMGEGMMLVGCKQCGELIIKNLRRG